MKFPVLSSVAKSRDNVIEFGGYNHNLVVPEREFYDTKNMTAACYPILSPRSKRGIIRTFDKPNGITAKEELAWVDGTTLYYNGANVGVVSDTPKQFVSMGAYLLVWPDKKIYNTATGDFENLGAEFSTTGSTYFRLCRDDGTEYSGYTTSDLAPENPADGDIWLDTSKSPASLKQFSSSTGTWTAIATTYVKIASPGIGANFSEYDGVTISGVTVDEQFNSDFILWSASDDYVVVTGIITQEMSQNTPVTVERKIPDMDFLTESENRVWGCSSEKHEIYACKLGDPKNWNCFMGVASDSYALTIGSDGDFTGAITHLGYVLFFKEDCIHKLYGTKPANYQLTSSAVRGVERGSEKSLVIVNETLYYKSRNGICAYDGSLPSTISQNLGTERYKNAVAGTVGNCYYISMQDSDGEWHMFVYDESLGVWEKEDNTHSLGFARRAGELYYIDASDNSLRSVKGTTSLYNEEGVPARLENNIDWMVETGDLMSFTPDRKYISKIQIRLSVPSGAHANVSLQYDSSGVWEKKANISEFRKGIYTLPIITPRCDHFRIKIEGSGDVKIYAISKISEGGSEL